MKRFLVCLFAFPLFCTAQTVYKVEGKNGVVTYSNSPIPGGTKVSLPEISLVPSGSKQGERRIDLPVPAIQNTPTTGGLLPPPPPVLGNTDVPRAQETKVDTNKADKSEPKPEANPPKRETNLAEAKLNLAKAKNLLASQEGVRNGDERNYQKYLDRIKPFQEEVARLEAEVARLGGK